MPSQISIVQVREDLIDQTYQLMIGYFDFYERNPPSREKLENHIQAIMQSDDHSIQFLAKVDNKFGGFVTLYDIFSTLTTGRVILMNDLYVEPKLRGHGIGKKLFLHAKEYTKDLGYPKMEWMTAPDNQKAREFYDHLGGKSSKWIYYSLDPQE